MVSVIIPTYNRKEMVVEAVRSVLSQDYKLFECLIVDDGSTDGTGQHLAGIFGDSIRILTQTNQGVSSARNRAIRETTSPYIAFLDSDDYWLKGKLKAQVDFLQSHPEYVICQTTEQWIRGDKRVNPRPVHMKKAGNLFADSLLRCMITPSSVVMIRSLLDEVGLFDETLPACEDYDLWLRITSRYEVALINKDYLVRRGGRSDQLSALHSLDKYRIIAIEKLLINQTLSMEQRKMTLEVLADKCSVYSQGCQKRGRSDEAGYYINLREKSLEELCRQS